MAKIICPYCGHKPFRTETGLAWHLEHEHGATSDSALRQQLSDYEVDYLHYMTPFGNCQSIFDKGILSFNQVRGVPHIDLASASVQRQRNRILDADRRLHDYVPLYFAKHTPMQRVWIQGSRGKAPLLNAEALVFIDLDAFEVLRIHGVVCTDGNAAAKGTSFYCAPVDLSVIDWGIVREPNCFSPEYRRRKAAEVLVPDCVPVGCFSRLVVYNDYVADKLINETDATLRGLEIVIDPSYY